MLGQYKNLVFKALARMGKLPVIEKLYSASETFYFAHPKGLHVKRDGWKEFTSYM